MWPPLRFVFARGCCISYDSLFLSPFLTRNMLFCPLLDSICLVPSRTDNPIYYIRVHTSVSRFYRDIDIGSAEAKGGLSRQPSSEGMPRINRLVLLDAYSLRLLITMCPVVFTCENGVANPSTLILFDFNGTIDTSSRQIARKSDQNETRRICSVSDGKYRDETIVFSCNSSCDETLSSVSWSTEKGGERWLRFYYLVAGRVRHGAT